jgi:ectoine hydroxylase-related dioxygenase (phytanoyl-CoA dioxygenase family)
MSFKEESHKHAFPFVEYQGYTSQSEKKNSFIQYEIPPHFLTKFSEVWCVANRGDLIMFDKNLAHTSNSNTSESYSAALVARIWDPSEDLTLSGECAAQPYGGNLGRQNLVVNPAT